MAQYFAEKSGKSADEYQKRLDERFGKGDVCCPECGLKMTLIRIWSKARGIVYDLVRGESGEEKTPGVVKDSGSVEPVEQLAFAF